MTKAHMNKVSYRFFYLAQICFFLFYPYCSFSQAAISQQTKGNQSPAVNVAPGGQSTINFNADLEGKIIEILTDIARKCMDQKTKLEDLKPEIEALTLYKAKALPYITRFASNYMELHINASDPNFLHDYRDKFSKSTLIAALISVIQKIYIMDPNARIYLHDLYMNQSVSGYNERDALLIGYYLWWFTIQDTEPILSKYLKGRAIDELDPVRKVLLRTYLHRNITEKYFIRPGLNKQLSMRKVTTDSGDSMYWETEALNLYRMQNRTAFITHLKEYIYESLEDKNAEYGHRTLMLPDIRNKLGDPRGLYLYGFDFYGNYVRNLAFNDVLLGKSYFNNSAIINIDTQNTTFLECDFKKAEIHNGWFDRTNFISTNLAESLFTYGFDPYFSRTNSAGSHYITGFGDSIISSSSFKETNMGNTIFVQADIIDTNFDNCVFTNGNSTFRSSLLLNVNFSVCDPKKIVFENVVVDELTLNNISNLSGFAKSDYVIQELDVNKAALLNGSCGHTECLNTGKKSSDETEGFLGKLRILEGLNSLQRHQTTFDRAKAIIAKQKLFIISSSTAEFKLTPERKYAYCVSIIEKCGELYPDEKKDFEESKRMLDKFVESRKELLGVLTNPVIPTLVKDVSLEVVENMNSPKNTRYLCNEMKRGKFKSIFDH